MPGSRYCDRKLHENCGCVGGCIAPPKTRAELEERLRAYRIEGRKNLGLYIELQVQRRRAQSEEVSRRTRRRIEQAQCVMGQA